MNTEYPYLEVKKPGVEEYIFQLEDIIKAKNEHRLTIGRSQDNDLVLPDPDKKVSRQHCILERSAGYWWVVDESSSNGTFVQNGNATEVDVRQNGRYQLTDGNVILILSRWIEPDRPVFWQLTFRDPQKTDRVSEFQLPPQFEYSLSQEKLFRVTSVEREEINLRPLERDLIHYMAERNQANERQPVVCGYEELIEALWSEPFGKNNNDITRLVWGIRNKIELDSGQSKILQTIKGRGYLLELNLLD